MTDQEQTLVWLKEVVPMKFIRQAQADEIERLRELANTAVQQDAEVRVTNADLAKEIERLQDELTATQKSLMGVMTRIGEVGQYAANLQWDLKASQAREEKLREWIEDSPVVIVSDDAIEAAKVSKREILALPHDNSALKERLAQERERCAKIVEKGKMMRTEYEGTVVVDWDSSEEAAEVLRNLGDK